MSKLYKGFESSCVQKEAKRKYKKHREVLLNKAFNNSRI